MTTLGRLNKRLRVAWRHITRRQRPSYIAQREPRTLVVILDGTLSTLRPGNETNAGLARNLVREVVRPASVFYEPGIQWGTWTSTADVITGRGLNRQIRRAYGFLASRYRPGDRIFLFGYSRGAFAVRSLAGVIDRIGLLTPANATERNVMQAYRLYECGGDAEAIKAFRDLRCHAKVEIEMLGVWDTVKALGLRLPLLWRLTEHKHAFHNHELAACVKHGYHALAIDENRAAFEPLLWNSSEETNGRLEQVWFRGTHGDVGGQLGGFLAARPLSNIPLVWMLEKAESCGLNLPNGWRSRFPMDPEAPSVGTWRGLGWLFLLRHRRRVCQDPSERIHDTVPPLPTRRSWIGALKPLPMGKITSR